jgi:hypothetical protein
MPSAEGCEGLHEPQASLSACRSTMDARKTRRVRNAARCGGVRLFFRRKSGKIGLVASQAWAGKRLVPLLSG